MQKPKEDLIEFIKVKFLYVHEIFKQYFRQFKVIEIHNCDFDVEGNTSTKI